MLVCSVSGISDASKQQVNGPIKSINNYDTILCSYLIHLLIVLQNFVMENYYASSSSEVKNRIESNQVLGHKRPLR